LGGENIIEHLFDEYFDGMVVVVDVNDGKYD
jgi:hypothetical protein